MIQRMELTDTSRRPGKPDRQYQKVKAFEQATLAENGLVMGTSSSMGKNRPGQPRVA